MPQRDDPRHNLRLSPELKAKLGHSSIDTGRSMNAEIIARLEQSFAPDPVAQLIAALKPIGALSDSDRKTVGHLLAELGAILAKPGKAK